MSDHAPLTSAPAAAVAPTDTLPKTLDFDGTSVEITDHDGAPWLTLSQIVTALGYDTPAAVTNLYTRNRAEFTPDMTALLRQGRTRVRIFSPRGAHLIGMFARTPRAKAFRRWVLDVLDRPNVGRHALPDLPAPAPEPQPPADPITPEVRAAIARRVQSTVLRQYDRLEADITAAVRRHVERCPEDRDLVRYVQHVDTPDSSLVVVHAADLWALGYQVAALPRALEGAMTALEVLEAATDRQWYPREGGG